VEFNLRAAIRLCVLSFRGVHNELSPALELTGCHIASETPTRGKFSCDVPIFVHAHLFRNQTGYTDRRTQKVNRKVVPIHAMKVYKGRRGIAPLPLNLGTRWR
jgi:hypothetical protein